MLSAETLRVLTPAIVLLALVLIMGSAWIRDRNARIRDLKEQVEDWREVARESEKARELDRESTRQQIEVMRTSEAVISGLRNALERKEREEK
jgi:uncharacterized membrane protein